MLTVVVRVLALVLLVTFLAWVGGRLLGLRHSWARALVASVLGILIGSLLALAVAPQTPLPYPLFFVFAILLPALLVSMGVSVLLEVLARPAPLVRVQSRLATVPHPLRAVRRWAIRERRYAHITWIVARHGLAPALLGRGRATPEAAPSAAVPTLIRHLRDALQEAGGVFVKLGQMLSTRADLLPATVRAELATLQDAVAPAPRAAVEALLTAELGAPPTTVFAAFAPEPIGTASIAQVYRAQVRSGEQVAVKVQRPGIGALIEGDLDILLRLARLVEARTSWGREFRVVDLAEGFAASLREELDFRVEARNIATVAAALAATKTRAVRVPMVYTDLSTSRILVLEWFDGRSVRDAGPLIAELGLDRLTLARDLLDTLMGQIMREGTFHADPHPGNVLVLRTGQLGLLDFGAVGRIDPFQQGALRAILAALQRRDAAELRLAQLDLAAETPADTNDVLLERTLARFMAQRLGPGMEFSAQMFSELVGLLLRFGLVFPPEIGAVFRAIVTFEGTLGVLCPDFRLMDEARTLATRWTREALTPAALGKTATAELQALLPLLRRLPRRLDRLTEAAERGALSVNVRLFADARDERLVTTLVSRAILAFLGAAIGLMAVLLLGQRGGPLLAPSLSVFQVLGYVGLCVSIALIRP